MHLLKWIIQINSTNLAKKTKHFYFQFMKCLESQYKLIEGYEVVWKRVSTKLLSLENESQDQVRSITTIFISCLLSQQNSLCLLKTLDISWGRTGRGVKNTSQNLVKWKQVCFSQAQNQVFRQLFLTVSLQWHFIVCSVASHCLFSSQSNVCIEVKSPRRAPCKLQKGIIWSETETMEQPSSLINQAV